MEIAISKNAAITHWLTLSILSKPMAYSFRNRPAIDASKAEQKNLPPMVMACEFAPELELPTVHIDNLTASFEAVNYLAQLGHKQIAEITGPDTSALSNFRSQGYQQALRRAGLTIDLTKSVSGDFSFDSGAKAMRKLLGSPTLQLQCSAITT
ncbi:transcriptional (co)regulator cytR [Vibrio sp. JCM 19236]|nr:transcriptional (co)regulator cytR [Vibrio sp. JCM 19236]